MDGGRRGRVDFDTALFSDELGQMVAEGSRAPGKTHPRPRDTPIEQKKKAKTKKNEMSEKRHEKNRKTKWKKMGGTYIAFIRWTVEKYVYSNEALLLV